MGKSYKQSSLKLSKYIILHNIFSLEVVQQIQKEYMILVK